MTNEQHSTPSALPDVGSLVRDTWNGRIGVVMDRVSGRVALRPQGGGVEWFALPEDLEAVALSEGLSEPVREANARSRGGRR
ncbi:hypothetical protein ABXV03_15760 [Streptomyces harbinensis]|uniref:hypothetical protein n=1 Tax=Streptomyces harbinensis TaxID=1176198 RepID=UPI0033911A75